MDQAPLTGLPRLHAHKEETRETEPGEMYGCILYMYIHVHVCNVVCVCLSSCHRMFVCVCLPWCTDLRTLKDSVGLLRITVVEASDLVAKDPNGKSDPFCVIKLGDMQEQKTSVIQATLNPKWNFTVSVSLVEPYIEPSLPPPLQMQFAVHDINTDVVEVSVFDKDLFSPNG